MPCRGRLGFRGRGGAATIPLMRMPEIQRRSTRAVRVGGLTIGGAAPVSVQSMTNTRTADAAATIAQVRQLAEAGAELVRVAVPTADDTAALPAIVKASRVPPCRVWSGQRLRCAGRNRMRRV